MTTTISYAATTDGHLSSFSSSYATARNGTGSVNVVAGDQHVTYGQEFAGGNYVVAEGFLRWSFALPADERATAAILALPHTEVTGASVPRGAEARQFDWGASLDAADWRNPAQFLTPQLGDMEAVHNAAGKTVYAGTRLLTDLVNSGVTSVPVVIATSRFYSGVGSAPTGSELNRIGAAESIGTAGDPALIIASAPRSTLFGVLGATVQLSDGSWIVLESDGAITPVITLRRHTGASVATIATLSADYGAPSGLQTFALATDGADVWVVGESATQVNAVAVQRFAWVSAGVYTAGAVQSVSLPFYSGRVNAVAVAYHATTTPTLAILAAHGPGKSIAGTTGADLGFVTIPAIPPAGSTITPTYSASALGTLLPGGSDAARFNTYGNEVGTGLDLVRSGDGTGYVASFPKGTIPGEEGQIASGRYDLAGSGALTTAAILSSGINYGSKDAGGKVRAVPISGTAVAVVSADPFPGNGLTVQPWQTTGSTWTALAPPVYLDAESIPSMPGPAALATSAAWDAVYAPYDNKVWVYYPDATDPRILRRTGVSMSTYQADRSELVVATVGAAGGTNLAVRAQRNASVGASALVTIAHRASGGALSTVYQLDSYAQAPTAPILTPKANFDATTAQVFTWTFTDPNAGDAQSAYALEIMDASTLTIAYQVAKWPSPSGGDTVPANALVNGKSYQWRIKTWDLLDQESPWSGYGTFSTAAGGTVTITDPAVDNPAGVVTDDYLIKWSVAGTTQASYRVVLVRTSDSATISDTGWITSTATQHTVSGMVSDTQYRVEVTVRNAASVSSGTGARLITPSYATPEVPVLTVEDRGPDGYMLLTVNNPTPTGDRPEAVENAVFRRPAGTLQWEPLGTCPPDGQFRDYTASAQVPYEYMVRAHA